MIRNYIRTMPDSAVIFDPKQGQVIIYYGLNSIDGSSAGNDVATYKLYNPCEHDGDPLNLHQQKSPSAFLPAGPTNPV